MIAGLVIGFVLGAVLCGAVLATNARSANRHRVLLPLDVRGVGEPRTATLDQVVEAARAAALRVVPRNSGFDVLSQPPAVYDHMVSARVVDPATVSAATLALTYDKSYPLALDVVLALVPVLGPLAVTLDGDRVVVDGGMDAHELTNAHAKYIRAQIRDRMM